MTNERARSELEQLYMSLSEEKKKALDVAFKAMEQSMPTMVYPQVDGITPTVVAQADGEKTCGTCRNEDTYHCAECENKSDYEQAQADGEYISRKALLEDLYKRDYTKFTHRDFVALVQYQDIVAIPSTEPTVAQERYEDLCEYFGSAKDILNNREDFKAWLERIKWHIHKAEELYEKYEQELKTGHWIALEEWKKDFKGFINELSMPKDDYNGIMEYIDELLVTPQPIRGRWIPVSEELPDKEGYYLCSVRYMYPPCNFFEPEKVKYMDDVTIQKFDGEFNIEVKAWMPLPPCYKPQESEDK